MALTNDRFHYLFEHFKQQRATAQELDEFWQGIAALPGDDLLIKELTMLWEAPELKQGIAKLPAWQHIEDEIKRRIQIVTPEQKTAHRIHFLKTTWFRYAAIVIVLFGAGTGLWYALQYKDSNTVAVNPYTMTSTIAPGGNKATLILADGSTVTLDNASNGKLAQQGNAQIVKLSNGQIVYNLKGAAAGEMMMNTMKTPRGGQYQLILPDGTKVWLNASSSITYPAMFTGKQRKVTITGEAYLEVAPIRISSTQSTSNVEPGSGQTKPFIVDINGRSSIEVLGTSFNINSYADEKSILTTLIEGSVKIRAGQKGPLATALLQPGQQAELKDNSSEIKIYKGVNTNQVIAWKNGFFNFENADLPAVMRQLERWYDIKVHYKGAIPAIKFKGELDRSMNLSEILTILTEMEINYKLQGRELTILP